MTTPPPRQWAIHVEVRLRPRLTTRFDAIRTQVQQYITRSCERINIPSPLEGWQEDPLLANSVEKIFVCESVCPATSLPLEEAVIQIHVYQPSEVEAFEEFTNSSGAREDADDTTASTTCELPNRSLEGLWDSLIYSNNIKIKLLDYIHATFVLSDANVDYNLVSWNRVVLLHGPPGTGKTSLCKALAQKLSIRLSHRYTNSRLLEINSHSLFSRWFSESGKLVQRLFSGINELVEDEDSFVVVLIDEVESLTAARAGAMAGTEPSDGLRVVNALLTQLDKLRTRKNVLIMATSNLPKAIDTAFVDRADIIQYIDLPPREAIYEILRSCILEMMNKGIVTPVTVPTLMQADMFSRLFTHDMEDLNEDSATPLDQARNVALRLLGLATECKNQKISGRALRRLPVLALAKYIGLGFTGHTFNGPTNNGSTGQGQVNVFIWLQAMQHTLAEQVAEKDRLESSIAN